MNEKLDWCIDMRRVRKIALQVVIVCTLVSVSSDNQAEVEYRYEGDFFDQFTCEGVGSCSIPDPAFTSYTTANYVRALIVLDEPLAGNLVLQDVTNLPGFSLTISDGLQTLTFPGEALLSTDTDGNITAPWSVIINGPVPPNNGVVTVNWPGGRGVADMGIVSAATGTFPDLPFDWGIASAPATWTRVYADIVYSNLGPLGSFSSTNGWSRPVLCTPTDCSTFFAFSAAVSFVAGVTTTLSSIELALSDQSDPFDQRPGETPFDVAIYTNTLSPDPATGVMVDKPGELLGFVATTAPENRSCEASDPNCLPFSLTRLKSVTIVDFSLLNIGLNEGDRYWIGLHPADPEERIAGVWWWNILESGLESRIWHSGGGGEDFNDVAVGSGFDGTTIQIESAFRVNGVPVASAEMEILTASNMIANLGPSDVTTGGNQNALMNFLMQATVAIQEGDFDEAIDKLEKALARTDGCQLRGVPDGDGPGRDWIIDCAAQAAVYASLTSALEALSP